MKSSPLQLKWVTYPQASYEALEGFEGNEKEPVSVTIDAEIRYALDGESHAFLKIETTPESPSPYKVTIVAIAGFEIDHQGARALYRAKSVQSLATTVAVNVARMLFAGSREQVAMMTSRGPYSSMTLESVFIESSDVTITSPGVAPEVVMRELFGASEEELKAISEARSNQDRPSPAAVTTAP